MQELVWHTISFYFKTVYWQISWCHKVFKYLAYKQLSANFMVITTILFTHTTFLWATCCLICFITIVKPFLTLILTTVHTIYLIWKKGSGPVWSIDRGCLFLHGTWFHLWYIQRSVNAHSLICISYWTYEIDYCSLSLSFHCYERYTMHRFHSCKWIIWVHIISNFPWNKFSLVILV
jgi:hypothetical protein